MFIKYVNAMGIFDVDENIDALKPAREMKFKKLFESMRDGSQVVIEEEIDGILIVCKEVTSEIKNGDLPFIADDDYETSAWRMCVGEKPVEEIDGLNSHLVFVGPDTVLEDFIEYIIEHTPISVWRDERMKEIYKSLFEMTENEIGLCDNMII